MQEQFINTLEIIVKKQLSQSITIESRWVSEKEMRDDLKWTPCLVSKRPGLTDHVYRICPKLLREWFKMNERQYTLCKL